MNSKTMRALMEHMVEQHRKERERYTQSKQAEQKTKEGNKK